MLRERLATTEQSWAQNQEKALCEQCSVPILKWKGTPSISTKTTRIKKPWRGFAKPHQGHMFFKIR